MSQAKGAGTRGWTRTMGLGAMVLLTGCSSDHDRSVAEENLHKWQDKGPPSYVYVLETGCLCSNQGTVRVVVTDAQVTSAIQLDSGDAVPGKTMTELLQSAVSEASRDNDSFEASYDSELGYLKYLAVDHTSASDDEYSKRVTCFGEGTDDDVCPG